MEHLYNDHKEHPSQHKNKFISYVVKHEFDGKAMETETKTWSEFSNGGKAIVEEILAS